MLEKLSRISQMIITKLINKNNPQKGEIISILSLEINESEALSRSCTHKEESNYALSNQEKVKLKRVLGLNNFDNQKTQKHNIDFLKEQLNNIEPLVVEKKEKINLEDYQKLDVHSKQRNGHLREKGNEDPDPHKKHRSKSTNSNKLQYIRNNHDIITQHQKYKSSDSTENSILMKSNGFGILYEQGEKLEKLLNHHESHGYSPQTPPYPNIVYSSGSEDEEDEGSSISEIGNKQSSLVAIKLYREQRA